MRNNYFVYIITNKSNRVLYIGVTSNLHKRIYQHTDKVVNSFSSKYNLNKLVYYEVFENPLDSIKREKQLKNWRREWKINLITKSNPQFKDLYNEILKYLPAQAGIQDDG